MMLKTLKTFDDLRFYELGDSTLLIDGIAIQYNARASLTFETNYTVMVEFDYDDPYSYEVITLLSGNIVELGYVNKNLTAHQVSAIMGMLQAG